MNNAKQISYRTFIKAVGLKNVKDVFRDYAWGHQRDLRMKDDPYVYYYRSTYDGVPCYYVRQSGVEFIFTEDEDSSTTPFIPIKANRYAILSDGAYLTASEIKSHHRAIFWGTKSPTLFQVNITSAPSKQAAHTLMKLIKQSRLDTIRMGNDEEDDEPASETLKWLSQFI